MKICYIIGGGSCDDFYIASNNKMIIAADKGYEYLTNNSIIPDIAVGDFDSLGYVPTDVKTICHSPEKNDTDMILAIKQGIIAEYKNFIIYGGLGGRHDHSMANIQTLSYLCDIGCRGWLCGEGYIYCVISDYIEFTQNMSGYISVFSLTDYSYHVSISGLKYELSDVTLTSSYPIGVSNEFIKKDSRISVSGGKLLIIWSQSPKSLVESML